jgi:predicted cobalt transporter CbtA
MHPAETPPPPPPVAESVVEEGVADPDARRRRTVSIVCTVVNVICGIFAVVLAVHIVLVLGSANQANGFAAFIDDWSAAVSLGLRDLFVPANEKVRVFLNDGMAAIAWLVIGALLTYLIRKFAMPSPRRVSHYRRVVR